MVELLHWALREVKWKKLRLYRKQCTLTIPAVVPQNAKCKEVATRCRCLVSVCALMWSYGGHCEIQKLGESLAYFLVVIHGIHFILGIG